MNRTVYRFFLTGLIPVLAWANSIKIIEDFDDEPVDKFPSSFRTYPFQRGKAAKVYSVQKEGKNHFLNATVKESTQNLAVQIFKRFHWDLSDHPHVSWRWRAKALPKTSDHKTFNDNACGVYIVFGGYGGKGIKYVWSSEAPPGTITTETADEFYIVTQESGSKNLGQWQNVSLNVAEEFQKLFRHKPNKDPAGIGILTDGDGTGTPSICDYDDFKIRK